MTDLQDRLKSRAEYEDNGGCCDRQMEDVGALLRDAHARIAELTEAIERAVQECESKQFDDVEFRLRAALNPPVQP